jgi:hypothetical protein
MKNASLWDIAPCILVEEDRRFRYVYYLRHQGDGYIPEGSRLHIPSLRENLKSHMSVKLVVVMLLL